MDLKSSWKDYTRNYLMVKVENKVCKIKIHKRDELKNLTNLMNG